jgi:hypothetical protein
MRRETPFWRRFSACSQICLLAALSAFRQSGRQWEIARCRRCARTRLMRRTKIASIRSQWEVASSADRLPLPFHSRDRPTEVQFHAHKMRGAFASQRRFSCAIHVETSPRRLCWKATRASPGIAPDAPGSKSVARADQPLILCWPEMRIVIRGPDSKCRNGRRQENSSADLGVETPKLRRTN